MARATTTCGCTAITSSPAPKSYLGATSGSMGYGFPAAIAAALETGRPAVAWTGDGCFQMTLNELSTAVQHGAQVVVIVANNGRYGTIRMHQERSYPGRVSGTDLANPDFAALARAYGAPRRDGRDRRRVRPGLRARAWPPAARGDRPQARPRSADDDADLERGAGTAPSNDRRP